MSLSPLSIRTLAGSYDARCPNVTHPSDVHAPRVAFLFTLCHTPAMLTLIISVGLFAAMGTLTLMAFFRHWP
jgi:hypothetical protein